ncbi:hypothetical protein LF63_0109370 [Oleiagrimonas soli]|uniref:DUF3034 family protein n=2 Tax=Oleiagrimonas soli TaxID=1543381 RepID=A0A099CUE2_9GAMM|nr:DUF3034 family protein [Oleiagrimonas soli]KGI77533.1 hypothetical protein LF63_0109370 [Oleiagrimonas soli]MBB6182996.1 hypothetical protein [Oleiagrimonas soli]
MDTHRTTPAILLGALLVSGCMMATTASAQDTSHTSTGGKLLLTGGVSQIEGAAGGGLTPWAVIGGYGTNDQIGGNAFYTRVQLPDYHLDDAGAMIGLYNRVEFSVAQQRFNTEKVGGLLGLGNGFTFKQTVVGVKVRLFGDAVLEQDSWVPQVSIGAQHKKNDQGAVVKFVGAKSDQGTDYYISATKLFLSQSLLANATVRFTKANQIGILGFGGDKHNGYQAEFEGSVAYLLSRKVAIGAEYRQKPNNLSIAKEDDWYDAFVAWAPTKHVSLTLAYADLGNIVIKDKQRGVYASFQVGF